MAEELILYIKKSLLESLPPDLCHILSDCCDAFDYKIKQISRWPNITVTKVLEKNPSALMLLSTSDIPSLENLPPAFPFTKLILFAANEQKNEFSSDNLQGHIETIRYLIGSKSPTFFNGFLSAILSFHSKKNRELTDVVSFIVNKSQQNSMSLTLNRSAQRTEMQKLVQEFFESQIENSSQGMVSGVSSYPKNIADVLDEFLMNAIWDANPSRENTSRSIPMQLEENEVVTIECRSDGKVLSLSVEDGHGTFPANALHGPLRFALGLKEVAKLKEGPGGAGLGLYMVLQKISVLIFEIERGKATRAIAILRADQSLKDMQREARSILLFDK